MKAIPNSNMFQRLMRRQEVRLVQPGSKLYEVSLAAAVHNTCNTREFYSWFFELAAKMYQIYSLKITP
jgi:hypothetical protein